MLALVLFGFSVALYLLAFNHLHRQAEERLETALNTLSAAVETDQEGVEWEPGARHLNLDFSILGDHVVWLVSDDEGQVLDRSQGGNDDHSFAEMFPAQRLTPPAHGTLKWTGTDWQAAQRWIHPEARTADPVEVSQSHPKDDSRKYPALSIAAGVSLGPVWTTLRQLAISLAGISVGIWVVALIAGRSVCRQALLPVKRMAGAAGEINVTDLAQRLPAITSRDELEDLNRAFNDLLDRLQEAFERQRRFTGDASHQLRTPLTAILGQVEVALRRERPAEEYRQVLATVQQSAGHLARMIESLLFLARADSEARLPALEPIELTTWLPQHLLTWSKHARAVDIRLECSTSKPCTIDAQPELLGELLNILLDNACRYSEPGTPIKVILQTMGESICVKVEDRGWGIADHELANLFVPFCRSEEARRRGIDGVGLGLSIAKRLAMLFECELTVASQAGGGSCFTLRFPRSS